MDIAITVADKIAVAEGAPQIVCGNSDYLVHFTFDSEWDDYEERTVRYAFFRDGELRHIDILFHGNQVIVPILHGIYEVAVGVYAGNLHTTTPARIPCVPSILDGDPIHEDPPDDVYNQLLEYLARIQRGFVTAASFVPCTEAEEISDFLHFAEEPEPIEEE